MASSTNGEGAVRAHPAGVGSLVPPSPACSPGPSCQRHHRLAVGHREGGHLQAREAFLHHHPQPASPNTLHQAVLDGPPASARSRRRHALSGGQTVGLHHLRGSTAPGTERIGRSVKPPNSGPGMPCPRTARAPMSSTPRSWPRPWSDRRPAGRDRSTRRPARPPAASSGPTTVRSIDSRSANSAIPGMSPTDRCSTVANSRMPAFPGAAKMRSTAGLCASDRQRACSSARPHDQVPPAPPSSPAHPANSSVWSRSGPTRPTGRERPPGRPTVQILRRRRGQVLGPGRPEMSPSHPSSSS